MYRTQGIVAVEKAIEKALQTKAYWEEKLQARDVTYGYYEEAPSLVVIDKAAKTLKVYEYETEQLEKRLTHSVITGLMGDKQKEGDLKTPVGVYDLVKRFVPGDPFYGQIAYALSYPNIMDKQQGKTGYGIWIHGHPLNNAPRYNKNTEGCVVMTNDLLDIFDTQVKGEKSIALINESGEVHTDAQTLSALLAQVFEWRNTWKYSDTEAYLEFYHQDFRRFDGTGIEEFARMKRLIFSRDEDKKILFKDLMVTPYPNEENKPLFRVSYYQEYETQNYQHRGTKEIYVDFTDKKMKILVEK
jgi:murein L,D-transpeptidase YafK